MTARDDLGTLFAIFSKSDRAADQLQTDWAKVVPVTFPQRDRWELDTESGVGISGTIWKAGGTVFAISGPGAKATRMGDLSNVDGLDPIDHVRRSGASRPFSLISWDCKRRRFTAARDPLGQADLFYRTTPSHLFFSSNLASLLSDPRYPTSLDYEGAVHYLLFGRPPIGHTLARGIGKIPAGHCIESTGKSNVIQRRYFTPLRNDASRVLSTAEKQNLLNVLDNAIRKTVPENQQAILLSGGVDSSFITSSLCRQVPASGLQAYTVEFAEPYQENETYYASLVSGVTGIKLNVVGMGTKDAIEHLPKVLKMAEPASAWASLTHLHLIDRVSSDGFSSFVSGLGADEVFGGYSRFLQFYRKFRFKEAKWSEASDQDFFDALLLTSRQATDNLFPGVPQFFSQSDFRKASRPPFTDWSHYLTTARFYKDCREIKPDAHLFELMTAHECQHRIPDLLFTSFEALGKERGVVGLYPFLDTEVVEIACGLAAAEKFWLKGKRWQNKRLLKEIAAPRLPPEILERRINSYTTPITLWLSDPYFRSVFRAFLMEGRLWQTGIISKQCRSDIDRQLFAMRVGRGRTQLQTALHQAWIMVTLSAWYEEWVR